MTKQMKRAGLTRLELVLVLVVIGLLFCMLTPATRRVREAARRTACMNNLKHLSLCALNYEAAYMEFPMGVGVKGQDGVLQSNPMSGFVSTLVYLQSHGYEDTVHEAALSDTDYAHWTCEIGVLRCPSSAGSTEGEFGRTSYGFSLGDVARNVSEQETLRGAYGYFKANRIGDIKDGTSNTIGMTEIGGGEVETVRGGCLTNGQSAWLDKPKQVFTVIKNGTYASGGKLIDRGSHWADGRAGVALVNTILPLNSPSFQVQGSPTADGIYSAGSLHIGGGNVAMLDGSVHFISENIDTGDDAATLTVEQMAENVPSPHGVWGASGTIASGDVADLE